jgi:hypothetical protein
VLSAALIAIGIIFAPIAVVAHWTQAELTSTDEFVHTFAPLINEADVQAFIADRASAALIAAVDIQGRTDELFSGLANSGLTPRLLQELALLKGTAVQNAEQLIQTTTANYVASPEFAMTFDRALRLADAQLLAALRSDGTSVLSVADGQVGIELAPVVAHVRTLLIARGLEFATSIPVVDHTVVLFQSAPLANAQHIYALIVAIGAWVPLITIVVLALGVFVARNRRLALFWATGAITLMMAALVVALDLGRIWVITSLLDGLVPVTVSDVLYDFITAFTRTTAVAVGAVAVLAFVALVVLDLLRRANWKST